MPVLERIKSRSPIVPNVVNNKNITSAYFLFQNKYPFCMIY
nr:MAG TPA: hypothetical protein [Caudoviricetes sp.]